MENYQKLLARLAEIGHLHTATAVLEWDQQCYMPRGGAQERAEQTALIGRIAHEMFVAEETAGLLAAAEQELAGAPPDGDAALTLRVIRRDFDKSVKIPSSLVAELNKSVALAHEIWVKARSDSRWSLFAPSLSHLLDLSRQVAQCYGYETEMYDALLDQYEPGMKTAEVRRVFEEIRPGLVSLVQTLAAAPEIDDSPLRRDFAEEKQAAFSLSVIRRLGYDFERGRLDKAVHPFCTSFTRNDVRITTRYDRNWLPCALMGTIHETGHALYELGFDPKDDDTPLSGAASLGFHESQSRLWENIVGRSRAFWNVFYPELQAAFPGVLDDVSLDAFYRAINKVQPSLIRVEADEVTYGLHIMLRFELEQAMINGQLTVDDIPEAWNERMREYLGIVPSNDAEGCLQDVHWSGASFGYFPTYALGSILSAQLYETAVAQDPQIPSDLEKGEYTGLLNWLREKVHKPGRRYLPAELVERICGEPAQSRSYLRYLNRKYRDVYGLDTA
ncbi:MAG: carboxypeptidase M32 [Capsulimonadales bacterium]|nr:carboxypeptidase M32 [Capsulimonadales bacterium]